MHTKWTDEELAIIEAKAELYTPKQIGITVPDSLNLKKTWVFPHSNCYCY